MMNQSDTPTTEREQEIKENLNFIGVNHHYGGDERVERVTGVVKVEKHPTQGFDLKATMFKIGDDTATVTFRANYGGNPLREVESVTIHDPIE